MKWSEIMNESVMRKGDELYDKAQALRNTGTPVFPPQDQIFRALSLTPPDKLKVCIIGQDPYHTPGAANGLAFSINPGRRIQPSLQNIFTEMVHDIGCPFPSSGDLTPWAEQGVLLLNRTLTVTGGQANSHANWGWQIFTEHVFQLCTTLPQPVVFILWGKFAQSLVNEVMLPANFYDNKLILKAPHPSPMSANYGFFGSKPFSKTNQFLTSHGSTPINWKLP